MEDDEFDAVAIAATNCDSDRLAVTLASVAGERLTVTLTADVAMAVSRQLAEFASTVEISARRLTPTKMPRGYAIGCGRHEPVVLVRFEDDLPYGFSPREALKLGKALIAEAEELELKPQPLRQ